jgi:hypothetical protein
MEIHMIRLITSWQEDDDSQVFLMSGFFRGADCDIDNYLLVAKLMERLSVSKRADHEFDMQRFDLKTLNDAEVKEQYQIKTSVRFVVLEILDDTVHISGAWENMRENINISAKESLGHY